MKKIIILSDTHGNQKLLRQAITNETRITHIFHLGDNYGDMDENPDLLENKKLIKVPGIFHAGYIDGSIPAIQEISLSGWNFLLVHNVNDLKKISTHTNLVLFGHTHNLSFETINKIQYLNPGHLKSKKDRKRKATYIVIDISAKVIQIHFKRINGKIIKSEIIKK
jgi:putative phosphoesterase